MTADPLATHDVANQPPPLVDYDVYGSDPALVAAVEREAGPSAHDDLHALGRRAGSAEAQRWGDLANANPPVLYTHDRYGHRVDRVEYHPAYHELMRVAIANGLHAAPWGPDAVPGAHVARAAKMIVWSQVDAGHTCPISMTYSVVPALRHQPALAVEWEPLLFSATYDPSFAPMADKAGVTCGMGMTEKQGGSDVRANSTRAEPDPAGDGAYLLTGHKWFCSAPMSDAFLMLAQAEAGLTCFLVPRWLPDRTPNVFRIQRLKDKLGDRSNASSELELAGTWAQVVGEPGRGVPTIIEMVNHTRLDCTLGATAIFRRGTVEAVHHAVHRRAFGGPLVDKPLMRNVLADLAVEAEAATISSIWLAGLFEGADARADPHAAALRRVATPVIKYWTCKRAPVHAVEALECLGGAGYVEESGLPRLFRQSPLNGIWEGSGNVICLDVLRVMARSPESVEVLLGELAGATGHDPRLDAALKDVQQELTDLEDLEGRARTVVERLALVLQGVLLVRFGDPAVADAFCASRLGPAGGRAYGTLPRGVDSDHIIERARVR
jgi:putative acyl-CoA dehydrogenase